MILCLPSGVKRNSRLFRALLHFSILAATAVPAFAQVFKWVDERGITHYGERPPQGAKAREVEDKLASPPPSRARQQPAPKSQPAPKGEPSSPPVPAVPGPAAAPAPKAPPTPQEQQAAARTARCDQERTALTRLRGGTTSYALNEKGERVTIDNSEAIAEQEKRVGEQCGS